MHNVHVLEYIFPGTTRIKSIENSRLLPGIAAESFRVVLFFYRVGQMCVVKSSQRKTR